MHTNFPAVKCALLFTDREMFENFIQVYVSFAAFLPPSLTLPQVTEATRLNAVLPWVKLWISFGFNVVGTIWDDINTQLNEMCNKGLVINILK